MRGGIDVGLREHAAAEQDGDLVGVDLVVFGLAAVDGLHVEGVAQDEGDAFLGAEVGEPVPGEHALDGDDESVAIGRNGLEKRSPGWLACCGAAGSRRPGSRMQTIHGPGVQVDAAVELVLLGVESPEVSSSACVLFSQHQHTTAVC